MATLEEIEKAAEQRNSLPAGLLASLRQQETGGKQKYIDDPAAYHYPLNDDGKRIAGHTGRVSTAFGPYGILESTAAQPGYGVKPLPSKSVEDQVNFAADYVAARAARAGSIQAGLAGYGEGNKYADQVLKRIKMETPSAPTAPSAIDKMAEDNMARNDVAASALSGMYQQLQGVTNVAKDILTSAAQDANLVKTTEQLAVASTQKATADAAAALGTNPSAGSYALGQLVAQSSELHNRRMAAAKEVEDIYSNPFRAFIESRVFRDSSAKKLAAITDQENAVNNRMKTLHDLTQETAQTNAVIAQSVTTASAQAAGRLAANELQLKAAQLDLDAIKTNAQGVVAVNNLKNNNFSIALQARDQQIQEASVILAQTNAGIQAENLKLVQEERAARTELKQEEINSRNSVLTAVNLGRKVNGNLPPFASYQEMATAAKMDKNLEDQIGKQYVQGMTAASTGTATVASDPYNALKYVRQTGAVLEGGRQKVISFLGETYDALANSTNPDTRKALGKESTAAPTFIETVATRAKGMRSNIMSGDKNIYAPPTISVLMNNPDLANTHIAKNILTPMKAGGMDALQPKQVVDQLVADVTAGKLTMEQADNELGFMATTIKGYNNNLWRYKDTAGLPNMDSVIVPLNDTGSFTNAVNALPKVTDNVKLPAGVGVIMDAPTMLMQQMLGGSNETMVNLDDPVARSAYLNRRIALTIPPVLRQQALVQQQKVSK